MAYRPFRIFTISVRMFLAAALAQALGCAGAVHDVPVRRTWLRGDRFEGDFGARLKTADPGRRFIALVDLTEQLDLRATTRRLRARSASKAEIRAGVISALEDVASRQQAKLRPLLTRLLAEGTIDSVQPVAVVNRVIVAGNAKGLLALAASAEVAVVRPEWTSESVAGLAADTPVEPASPDGDSFQSWAVAAMKADRLWREGLDGTGVVVAGIDTGAFEAHEQLAHRRVPGERGWFDPVEGSVVAHDRHGHGTGVLSQAVGANPDGRVVGIAPGAHWAMALGNWKNFYARSRMTLAADWVLRVARPDVVVNAWSHDEGVCCEFDRPFIDAWKASGIFVVFPAGNGGPQPASGESPAQLRGIFPNGGAVFSVAGLTTTGVADALSSRGPSRCGSLAFPTLAAPGANLPIATPGGPKAYLLGEGTSLAAGLVGGAAALLLQAAPETDPDTMERVLVGSTRDILPTGKDTATGAGAIDLDAALTRLRALSSTK